MGGGGATAVGQNPISNLIIQARDKSNKVSSEMDFEESCIKSTINAKILTVQY